MPRSFFRALLCAGATVFAMPLAGAANLLANPGFEDGLNGWEASGGAALRSANPPPFEGDFYVFGNSTALFAVAQEVDLLADGTVNQQSIDDGALKLLFGGYQAGFGTQTDAGQISVRLFGASGEQLNLVSLPSFFSNNTWVEQRGETFLLPGTRKVRFEFVGTRKQGSNNDAYLDAAFVEVAPVPLPAGLPLLAMALGVCGAVGARRRRG
ncbi:MAG: hypothetical protein AB7I01_20810 [Gammaproteobacteria bacterium]